MNITTYKIDSRLLIFINPVLHKSGVQYYQVHCHFFRLPVHVLYIYLIYLYTPGREIIYICIYTVYTNESHIPFTQETQPEIHTSNNAQV